MNNEHEHEKKRLFIGEFIWGESLQKPEYTKWIDGEPNNSGGNEDCTAKTPVGWGDYNCDLDGSAFDLYIHALCEV